MSRVYFFKSRQFKHHFCPNVVTKNLPKFLLTCLKAWLKKKQKRPHFDFAIFVISNHIQQFYESCHTFCPNFHRFCLNFKGFCPIFSKSKLWGCSWTPCTPPPTPVPSIPFHFDRYYDFLDAVCVTFDHRKIKS